MLYRPAGPPLAWVLFSVGFGGTRQSYAYLGRAWARAGIAVAVVEHVGSNLEVLKSFSQGSREERNAEVVRRVQDQEELTARPWDLEFVRHSLEEEIDGAPLGLGGHSYGSYTVLANLGSQPMPISRPLPRFPDVSASLLASPQPPGMLFPESSYAELTLPVLVLTGDKDDLLDGSADYRAREKVFQQLPAENANLVVLKGVDHMTFAGLGLGVAPTLDEIARLTTRWWQMTLLEPTPVWQRAEELKQSLKRLEATVE